MPKRKSPRLYVPIDARFFDDDRIIHVGEKAAWLFLNVLASIKLDRADGTISRTKIARLGIVGWQTRIEKLLEAELLLELESPEQAQITYLVPSWSKWNLLSYEIDEQREQARSAALKRWGKDADRNATRMRNPMRSAMQDKTKQDKTNPTSVGELVHNLLTEISSTDGELDE